MITKLARRFAGQSPVRATRRPYQGALLETLESRTLLSVAAPAPAPALVGVSPALPLTFFFADSAGSVNYNAAAQAFGIQATPTLFVSPQGTAVSLDGAPTFALNLQVDGNGKLVGSNPNGPDLVVTGSIAVDNATYTGTLLTGKIAQFGAESTDPAGGVATFDFRLTVTGGSLAPLFANHSIGVVVTSEGSTYNGSFQTNFTGEITKGNIGAVGLNIVKTANVDTADSGEAVTYTYTVTNTTGAAIASVKLVDDNGTPANTHDDFTPTLVSGDTNGNGLLDASETWIYTATAPITGPAGGGVVTSSATVTGQLDNVTLAATASVNVTVNAPAVVPVPSSGNVTVCVKADTCQVTAGSQAGFTITLHARTLSTGVTLTDLLPAGAGNDINWKIDTTVGKPAAFTLTGAVGHQTLTLTTAAGTMSCNQVLMIHVVGTTSALDVGALADTASVKPNTGCGGTATATTTINAPVTHNPCGGGEQHGGHDGNNCGDQSHSGTCDRDGYQYAGLSCKDLLDYLKRGAQGLCDALRGAAASCLTFPTCDRTIQTGKVTCDHGK